MLNPDLSVIIPVYEAQFSLEELYSGLHQTISGMNLSFEIIFVDDASKDNSWKVIQELALTHSNIRALKLGRNYGQHNALLAGIRGARGSIIITMDDDLQHPPEEIPRLISKINDGFDVVYGSPSKEKHGFFRDLASQITKIALQKSMGHVAAQNISAFRAFKVQMRDGFQSYFAPTVNIDVLLTWSTSKFISIKVNHKHRKYGSSNYTPAKLIRHAISMLTGFSVMPLKFAGILGILIAIFGVFILLFVLIQYYLYGVEVPGFPFLASIISIFSGAQLFAMGIIGEYLAGVHQRSMNKPPYFLSEKINFDRT
jgi:glycosyltransferase involved in cell wall biosynthesis